MQIQDDFLKEKNHHKRKRFKFNSETLTKQDKQLISNYFKRNDDK